MSEQIKNLNTAGDHPYLHLLPIIVCFSFAVFVLAISSVNFANLGGFVGVFSFATIVFVVIQLGAMWAVLGPGKYWKSAGLSFVACAIPGITSLLSLAIVFRSAGRTEIIALSAFAPIAWVMAQLPYWYLRLFFNWRITNVEILGAVGSGFRSHCIGNRDGLDSRYLFIGPDVYMVSNFIHRCVRISDHHPPPTRIFYREGATKAISVDNQASSQNNVG